MWTNTIPVLSITHITPEVLAGMKDPAMFQEIEGVSIERATYEYGVFVRLINTSEEKVHELPQCLQEVRAWAVKQKYEDWIRFDTDGDLVEELATY